MKDGRKVDVESHYAVVLRENHIAATLYTFEEIVHIAEICAIEIGDMRIEVK